MRRLLLAILAACLLTTAPAASQTTSPTTTTTWTKCADEGGTCSFSGTATVRYGSGSTWITKVVTGPVACNNDIWTDPLFGTVKECDLATVAASTPTPTPAPTPTSTYPAIPVFYAPTDAAVETNGVAEVRIVRGSPSATASVFHVTTDDVSMISTAIWPADFPDKVDITVTIQPGQMIGSAMIPLIHHNSFQDTKVIAIEIDPVSNATIDRNLVPLVVYDGDRSHIDAWKPAPAIVPQGYVQLKVDSDGFPKIETYLGSYKPDYSNLYPYGVAGEVFRVIDSGYAAVSNRKVWHVTKFNRFPRDAWFYEDDLRPVLPAS